MKTIENYKKDDGYELNGVVYEDAEELLQQGFLGFCGCGAPDMSLLYVLGGLEIIDETGPDDLAGYDKWWREYKARKLKYFRSEQAAFFFYYWAHKAGFADHGGSVPGWLNEEGSQLLSLLREWRSI